MWIQNLIAFFGLFSFGWKLGDKNTKGKLRDKNLKDVPFRPFPWFVFPDWFWSSLGITMLMFIAVPSLFLIIFSTVSWSLFTWIYSTRLRRPIRLVGNAIQHWASYLGERILKDKRNSPFLPWMAAHLILCPSLLFWAWQRHQAYGFEFPTMLMYNFLRIGPRYRFFAYHHVLIHREGHSRGGLFKGKYKKIFGRMNQFFFALFYGQVPGTYYASHVKIHHRWHNDVDDAHTNIDLDRSKLWSLTLYLPRFFYFWSGITSLAFFLKRREMRLALEMVYGMTLYYSVLTLLLCYDWKFALGYFVYPFMESMTFLGSIGYLWHAFVDPNDPQNQYVNSVTILNGADNIWNEDYHVVHHFAPHIHWSEVPAYFEKTKHLYAKNKATIFQNTEEGLLLAMLFGGKWDDLARHFVDLEGKMTHEEKKALLLERLSFTARPPKTLKVLNGFSDFWRGLNEWGTTSERNWDSGKSN